MPLRREQVIDAAVELLDAVGLDAFTTRALTDRLGVQRGTLYWHVKSKHELLAAVASKIMEPSFAAVDGDEGLDWAEAFAEFGQRMRAAMMAHRDAARLVATHITMNRQGLARMEVHLERLRAAGLPPELSSRFGDTIASYVTGFVLQEQAQASEVVPESEVDPATMPNLHSWLANGYPDSHEVFTACVGTIILGMRAEVAALEAN
jgi:TetR/AcrR family tetracycline transcriptional repressor